MIEVKNHQKFDVFLSHNGQEKDIAIEIGTSLRACGLRVWLDVWELRPGLSWQEGIINGLENSLACAVLIGNSGYGGWHKREMEAALNKQGPDYPVIPVLLPGAPARGDIGSFLQLLTWVDFRSGVKDTAALNRLIWGITGLRPEEAVQVNPIDTKDIVSRIEIDNDRFRIENPKNGDLLSGPSLFSGLGPANSTVFLHYRAPGEKDFALGPMIETDSEGNWSTLGPHESYFGDISAGPYEIYAAGAQDFGASQPITVYYRDRTSLKRLTQVVSKTADNIEISYRLASAFIEGTKLQERRLIHSDKIQGSVDRTESLAQEVGSRLSKMLLGFVSHDELEVAVEIDNKGRISLSPPTAWATYYAFPIPRGERAYGTHPSSNLKDLSDMRMTQIGWRIYPHVGRIPLTPFGEQFKATSSYLEIRHEGYRPEFISLEKAGSGTYHLTLLPVLHKRIAVIDFPAVNSDVSIGSFSQLIVQEVVSALESTPQLATFGYFSDQPATSVGPPQSFHDQFMDELGRPAVAIGNEILTLYDVHAIQEQLDSINTFMVSGEGRHLQRKELDINYIIRGSYKLFSP